MSPACDNIGQIVNSNPARPLEWPNTEIFKLDNNYKHSGWFTCCPGLRLVLPDRLLIVLIWSQVVAVTKFIQVVKNQQMQLKENSIQWENSWDNSTARMWKLLELWGRARAYARWTTITFPAGIHIFRMRIRQSTARGSFRIAHCSLRLHPHKRAIRMCGETWRAAL